MIIRILFVLVCTALASLFVFTGPGPSTPYLVLPVVLVVAAGVVLLEWFAKNFNKENVTRIFKGFVVSLLLGAGLSAIARSFGLQMTWFYRTFIYLSSLYIGVALVSQLDLVLGRVGTSAGSTMPAECVKVLDTSVIIDGRIADVVETGFIEGVLVVPKFVLDELQQIADSSDSIKRSRGRRGLDVLNRLKKDKNTLVRITDQDFPEIPDVDSKLVKLGKELGGKVVTNDFNLFKVAEIQGVTVLNINQLANSLKPVVLPGEKMKIVVIKEGKDPGQGIGYLDDGTMVVVDSGKKYVGEEIQVSVTSVLQTPAGRMIFAKYES
ncbi:MAG: PIN/TRAM domain-containing protein [Spirochaetota bacterium]